MTETSPALPAAVTRLAALAVGVVLIAQVHLPGRPSTLCALRAVTGIPCPFCGATTAAVALGQGRLTDAVRASPLAVLGAPFVAALPLLRARLQRLPGRSVALALGGVLLAAELWQLGRFGLV